MKQERGWPANWTAAIGKTVRLVRERQKLSAQQLSVRCAVAGYPIPRNTIANLENGRKETLPLHELVILARALGVPPVELLYPIGQTEQLEVVPGLTGRPMTAVDWFCGVVPRPDGSVKVTADGAPEMDAITWDTAVGLYREIEDTLEGLAFERTRLYGLPPDSTEMRKAIAYSVKAHETSLRRLLARCSELGIESPALDRDQVEAFEYADQVKELAESFGIRVDDLIAEVDDGEH